MKGFSPTWSSQSFSVECHAKINWFLDVGQRRPDGYHEVDTIMQRISLSDDLAFEPVAADRIEFEDGGVCDCAATDNLIVRAARLLKVASGCTRGARIRLTKRVPMAAGLGGGSANAAVTLRALASLWALDVSDAALRPILRTLGADVPFFLGTSAARCQGIGDVLTPIAPHEYHLVLWNPGVPLSTAAVYATFDKKQRPRRDSAEFLAAYASGDVAALATAIWNNLSFASDESMPMLATMREICLELGACVAWISGSGPTVVSLCTSAETAEALADGLRRDANAHHVIEPVTTML